MQRYFVFVNFLLGMAAHNLKITKQFTSSGWSAATMDPTFMVKYLDGTATYAPFLATTPDCMVLSPFSVAMMGNYRVEYDAEYFRLTKFRMAPSRLSATYAFGDFATCELVAKKYGWDLCQVRQFRLEPHPLNRVLKCNMELVSLARYQGMFPPSQDFISALWEAYWTGNASFQCPEGGAPVNVAPGEIWEYLVEGRLVLEDGQPNVATSAP